MQQTSAPAPTGSRLNFDLSPGNWKQYGRGFPDAGVPVRSCDDIGIITDFPWSDKADPNAGPNWNGYLLTGIVGNTLRAPSPKPGNVAWNKANPQPLLPPSLSLDIKKRLVYEFHCNVSDGARLNYQSDTNNTDLTTPAGLRPMIEGGERWWCKQRWVLEKTDGLFRLDVALDPGNWFDVNGLSADAGMNGKPQASYLDALVRPLRMGLTFGGGFFAGHGVCVSNGNAVFSLSAFYTY